MFKLMRKDEGFTLVELMVVVLIIGILVAIAIPVFNNASKKAKINTCAANIRTIDGAIAQKAATDGKTIDDLGTITVADLVDGGFLKSEPVCPFGGENKYEIANGAVTPHNHQ